MHSKKGQEATVETTEVAGSPHVVVLKGSTGNVGTYLLDTLASNPKVAAIHFLIRSKDAENRQVSLLADRGLSTTLPHPKIHFHTSDFAKDGLDLPSDIRESIASTATHYLHCAWPVDWNKSLSSFEPAIRGVTNLIRFVVSGNIEAKLFFISSVAAAGYWGAVPGARLKVPEEEIEDWKVARFGYGQSKLVSERLIADAAHGSGLTGAICRVGQIGGPVDHEGKGSWPAQDWLPSLIASSKQLGAIPRTFGPADDVDWVPVDRLSDILCELLFAPQKPKSTAYYQVVNPQKTSWRELLPAIDRYFGDSVDVVELPAWTRLLDESGNGSIPLTKNPALKLLTFFNDLTEKAIHLPKARSATLDVKRTSKASPSLAGLDAVNQKWMTLWLEQWAF